MPPSAIESEVVGASLMSRRVAVVRARMEVQATANWKRRASLLRKRVSACSLISPIGRYRPGSRRHAGHRIDEQSG